MLTPNLVVASCARMALCGEVVAVAERRTILVRDLRTSVERSVTTAWDIDRIELSPDARYLLAIGDSGCRGVVWEISSTEEMVSLGGKGQPSGTLRAGFYSHINMMVVATEGASRLIGIDLSTRSQRFWAGLAGTIVFRCERMIGLGSGWIALLGYRAGEQYDSIITMPFDRLSTYEGAVQEALLDRVTLRDSGDRLAIGPCGDRMAVVFRDASALEDDDDEDNPPRGPVEGFKGLCVWELESLRLVQRIEYDGPVESGSNVGGDESCIAIQGSTKIDVVNRRSGNIETVTGTTVALDRDHLIAGSSVLGGLAVRDLRAATR